MRRSMRSSNSRSSGGSVLLLALTAAAALCLVLGRGGVLVNAFQLPASSVQQQPSSSSLWTTGRRPARAAAGPLYASTLPRRECYYVCPNQSIPSIPFDLVFDREQKKNHHKITAGGSSRAELSEQMRQMRADMEKDENVSRDRVCVFVCVCACVLSVQQDRTRLMDGMDGPIDPTKHMPTGPPPRPHAHR